MEKYQPSLKLSQWEQKAKFQIEDIKTIWRELKRNYNSFKYSGMNEIYKTVIEVYSGSVY